MPYISQALDNRENQALIFYKHQIPIVDFKELFTSFM